MCSACPKERKEVIESMLDKGLSYPISLNRSGLEMLDSRMDRRIESFKIREQESSLYGKIFGDSHAKMLSRKGKMRIDR